MCNNGARARKKMEAEETGKNERKVKVKKEVMVIYRKGVSDLSREIWIYPLGRSIPLLHVSCKNLCGYNARRPLRVRFKERDDYSVRFSR